MNPTTGRTSGRIGAWRYSHTSYETVTEPYYAAILPIAMHFVGVDLCKHCPHSDRIRLRRVPKWLEVNRDDGYGKLIPITQLFKRRMRAWLKRTSR